MKKNHFEKYTEYWDDWHSEWNKNRNPIMKDWNIPILGKIEGQTHPVVDYFPEPYYCRDFDNKLDAIFLSINPGGGGPTQYRNNSGSKLIQHYESVNSYSASINKLLQINSKTADFFNHRENKTKEITEKENVNVLCADLVPWHTPNQSNIKDYILANIPCIKKNVISPLMKIARDTSVMNEKLSNKIIVRGTSFRDILNEVIPVIITSLRLEKVKAETKYFAISEEKTKFIEQFSTFLTIVSLGEFKFYVFTGGQGMYIPPLNKLAYPINNKSKPQTIKNLLLS